MPPSLIQTSSFFFNVIWIPALFNIHLLSMDIYYAARLAVNKSAAYSTCHPASGKTLSLTKSAIFKIHVSQISTNFQQSFFINP